MILENMCAAFDVVDWIFPQYTWLADKTDIELSCHYIFFSIYFSNHIAAAADWLDAYISGENKTCAVDTRGHKRSN